MAAVHYPVPIHLQAAWAEFASDAAFPNAERLARESISLPLWPGMTDVQVDRCVDALTRAVVPYAADLDEVAS
jgi:dTDP-4-amino-4,6-dideoxygalactose transaminase